MEKLEIGTKVKVNLSEDAGRKLGIGRGVVGLGVITGQYPLGHYLDGPSSKAGTKTRMAIADKYNAITPV